jgi:hypothetical protein
MFPAPGASARLHRSRPIERAGVTAQPAALADSETSGAVPDTWMDGMGMGPSP